MKLNNMCAIDFMRHKATSSASLFEAAFIQTWDQN